MNSTLATDKNNWIYKTILFLISQNISLFGSSVVAYAIVWHITLETSSGTWIMLATIAAALPNVLVSFFGGVWADRYNRKYLIMLSDAFIAVTTLGLAIAFLMGYNHIWLLLVVSAIRSFGAGIQGPAVNAIYPQLVPENKLTKIQGINSTLSSVLLLLSPAAGGVILGSIGIVWALMVDVVTAFIAITIMAFIKVKKHRVKDEFVSMTTDIKKGLQYAFSIPALKNIIICYIFCFFLITPASVMTPLLIERTFGNEVWLLTINEVVWTIGSLIGGIFISLKGSFRNKIATMSICILGLGLFFGLAGVVPNFVLFTAVMGIAGLFFPILVTVETVYIQELSDPGYLGRVFSILQMASLSAMPVAILFFGPLADIISVQVILIFSGILLFVVGAVYWQKNKHFASTK